MCVWMLRIKNLVVRVLCCVSGDVWPAPLPLPHGLRAAPGLVAGAAVVLQGLGIVGSCSDGGLGLRIGTVIVPRGLKNGRGWWREA